MNDQEREKAAALLAEYQELAKIKIAQNLPHKDVQPLTPSDIMLLRALMHPTARAESKAMTRDLLAYIHEQQIVIAEDIYSHFQWSDKPVMKRLKLLREFGIVKRVSKKYYIATPRLEIIMTKFIDRLCN